MATITHLGYALLGLAYSEAQTGYALRKVFETTPLGNYSSSPGSIYPAISKLVKDGLLEQCQATPNAKRLYHITPEGAHALKLWLKQPVTKGEVSRDIGSVLLRFAFLQCIPNVATTRRFLRSLIDALVAHLSDLDCYLVSPEASVLTRHGRLSVLNGISGYQAHLDWARVALAEFEK